MFKTSRLPILCLIAIIIVFLGWNLLIKNPYWLRSTGINGIQIFAGVLSFVWLFRAYIRHTDCFRNF